SWHDLSSVRVDGAAVVPRLDDLLGAWPHAYLNIDMKSDGAVAPTVAAVRGADALDRVLLASFQDVRLAWARAVLGDRVAMSLGRSGCVRLWTASRVGIGARRTVRRAVAAQMPSRAVDRRFVNYAHRLGLAVHAWTVNDAETARDLLDRGVDGIMTDHLDVL